ncbi:MAG: glycerophosphodiester phosphodiesterase [Alkalispirochaeta sp.]
MDVLIFGHRGYAARRVENTVAAFELAAETPGVAGVELDVQIARDGEVVVAHDGDLRRLADDPRRIVEVSSGELATTALHATDRDGTERTTVGIPTLNTVVDSLPSSMRIDIELKSYDDTPGNIPERVAKLISDRECSDRTIADRIIVSSFDPRMIRRFRRTIQKLGGSPVATAVIYSEDREVPWFLRTGLGVSLSGSEIAKPSWRTALSTTRRGARAAGRGAGGERGGGRDDGHGGHRGSSQRRAEDDRRLRRPAGRSRAPLYVWTINEREVLRRLLERDVNGVIGDDPGELVEWATAIAGRSAAPDGGRRPETRSE